MKPPRISICIPTYNGRAHLKECLESVRAQTFNDFEVVICDDQSSDGTLDFARELAQGDERFRFMQNPRRFGLAGNWNNCVEQARGEWIKFVFQDDLLKPDCLEKMHGAAMAGNAWFVCCQRDFLFGPEVPPHVCAYYPASVQRIDAFFTGHNSISAEQFARGVVARFRDNLIGEPTVTLLHRSVFEKCGMFNPNLIMCCDYEFWNRVGSMTGVTYIPEVLATFRVHGKSTSAENEAKRGFRMTLLDWFILLHDTAYGDGRESLRQASAQKYGLHFIRHECGDQALIAWRTLSRTKKQRPEEGRLLQQEWDGVAKLYPRMKWLVVEAWFFDIIRRFRRNLSLTGLKRVARKFFGLCVPSTK